MPTRSVYAKVSPENMSYLDALAQAAEGSKSQVINLIVTEARLRGWSVTVSGARITDPGRDMDTAAGAGHSSVPEG